MEDHKNRTRAYFVRAHNRIYRILVYLCFVVLAAMFGTVNLRESHLEKRSSLTNYQPLGRHL